MKVPPGVANPTSWLRWSQTRIKKTNRSRTYSTCDVISQPSACSSPQTDIKNAAPATDGPERCSEEVHKHTTSANYSAAILIVTHILEMTAMSAITLVKILSDHSTDTVLPQTLSTAESIALFSSYHVPYVLTIAVYIIFMFGPLLALTAISFIWALRSQDFKGRSAARIVCWVLHLFQASLIWRYLKIQLAYDSSDLAELSTLRFVQVHIHTLPFLVLHTVFTLSSLKSFTFSLCLGLTLLVSAAITVVVATTVRKPPHPSSLSLPTISQACDVELNNEVAGREDTRARVIVGITTWCSLWCRVMSLATLFCLHMPWATSIIIIHWISTFLCVCIQDDFKVVSANHNKKWLRRTFLAYLLIWDWHVFRDDTSALNICARPKFPALFYTVVSSENLSIVIIWFVISCYRLPLSVCLAVLSSVTLFQLTAIVLLVLSYLYYSSLCSNTIVRSPTVKVVSQISENSQHKRFSLERNKSPIASNISMSTSYVDFKECDGTEMQEPTNTATSQVEQIHQTGQPTLKYSTSLTQHLLFRGLHPSMFSFSSDLSPPNPKSDKSSMGNESFNSRNTNTIAQTKPVHKPHESFSDSFSSLSCGTTHRNLYSSLMCKRLSSVPLHSHSRARRHTSCHNGDCHCKIFDIIEQQCQLSATHRDKKDTSAKTRHHNNKEVTKVNVTCRKDLERLRARNAADLAIHRQVDPKLTRHSSDKFNKAGSSTGYPSDTEITATIDSVSTASVESHSTYTTWPVGRGPRLANILSRDKDHDYVTAWLKHQQSRERHCVIDDLNKKGKQQKLKVSQTLVQNLETVV